MRRLSTALTLLTMLAAVAAAGSQPDAALHAGLVSAAWPWDGWVDAPDPRESGHGVP